MANDNPPPQQPEPPKIPPAPDQSLSSTITQGLKPTRIPSQPDRSLQSSRTMNETLQKRTK